MNISHLQVFSKPLNTSLFAKENTKSHQLTPLCFNPSNPSPYEPPEAHIPTFQFKGSTQFFIDRGDYCGRETALSTSLYGTAVSWQQVGDGEKHQSRNPEDTCLRGLLSYAKIIQAVRIHCERFRDLCSQIHLKEIFFCSERTTETFLQADNSEALTAATSDMWIIFSPKCS